LACFFQCADGLLRTIASQNIFNSLAGKASSRPAYWIVPRYTPFDPSICIALRAMEHSTAAVVFISFRYTAFVTLEVGTKDCSDEYSTGYYFFVKYYFCIFP
jgi:hypothetical protein